MDYRSLSGYPPCGSLIAIHMSCPDQVHLEKAAGYVRSFLAKVVGKAPVSILGPTDEAIARIADVWRKVLYIKGGTGAYIRAVRGRLEKYIESNEGFSNVEITYETTI